MQPIPALNKASFTCPHCHANAAQAWSQGFAKPGPSISVPTSITGSIESLAANLEMLGFGSQQKTLSGMASMPMIGLPHDKLQFIEDRKVGAARKAAKAAAENSPAETP